MQCVSENTKHLKINHIMQYEKQTWQEQLQLLAHLCPCWQERTLLRDTVLPGQISSVKYRF